MAPRRLENRSKMPPGGLPGASREPELIFDAFFVSLGALLGRSWGALGVVLGPLGPLPGRSWGSFWPLGGHFSQLFGKSCWKLGPGMQKRRFLAVFLCCCMLV